MARSVRVVHRREGYRELRVSPGAWADIARRAEAISDACNAQSSWGGYDFEVMNLSTDHAEANVWTIDDRGVEDNARSNRLLRNLDAGR